MPLEILEKSKPKPSHLDFQYQLPEKCEKWYNWKSVTTTLHFCFKPLPLTTKFPNQSQKKKCAIGNPGEKKEKNLPPRFPILITREMVQLEIRNHHYLF